MADQVTVDLLFEIYKKIKTEGLEREEYEKIKTLSVAPGLSVEDYVGMRLSLGNVEWKNNRLTGSW